MTKQPTIGKTNLVLAAMLRSANTIPAIRADTGLSLKDVHAVVYRLEEQGRVIADNYDKPRRDQVLRVIRFEAVLKRNFKRVHPTKKIEESLLAELTLRARRQVQADAHATEFHPFQGMCMQLIALRNKAQRQRTSSRGTSAH